MLQYYNTALCLLSLSLSIYTLSLLLTHTPMVDTEARQRIELVNGQLDAVIQRSAQIESVRMTRIELELCRNAIKQPRLFDCP